MTESFRDEAETDSQGLSESGTLALRNVIAALADGEHLQRALGGVAQVSHILLTVDNLGEAIPLALKTLGETLQIDSVTLYRIEGERGSAEEAYVYETGWFAFFVPEIPRHWPLSIPTVREWDAEFRRGEAVRSTAAQQVPGLREILERKLTASFLFVPVPGIDRHWGAIGFTSADPERVWDGSEESILSTIAACIGGAIQRDRAAEREMDLQRKLLESRQMESLGMLARGVAHDFNHVLTLLSGHLQLLARDDSLSDDAHTRLRQAILAADGATDLIRQLRVYAGQAELHKGDVIVANLLRETAMLVKPMLDETIRIDLDLEAGLPSLRADATQLRQVFMNLMQNAGEAMSPDGGAIRVRARRAVPDVGEGGGAFVIIEVSDTGPGIDSRERDRIFEPFFSTKGEGRGLGLAAVQAIVRAHGGSLDVDSLPGAGSTFRVVLPASAVAQEPQPDA